MPVDLLNLPPALAYPFGALLLYRWGIIPAIRGTLAMLRDVQRYRESK
jgi:hypothetical protein